MAPRKKLTPEDKKKLDNSKVPNVTNRRMIKAVEKDDWDEADRLYTMQQKAVRDEREKKDKN